jgi:phosphoglucomutase
LDQKLGTSGLRKTVRVFPPPHYTENFTQCVFDVVARAEDQTLVIGARWPLPQPRGRAAGDRYDRGKWLRPGVVGSRGILALAAASTENRKFGACLASF